ncbi:MAG: crossover junction endodeoxyribonuclease RuvC [Patescibacteria group bacterium]|jgi:crossover junction endodeoxyribonuclease RuvC
MRILGIDPGLAITGFGVIIKDKNKINLLASGCILTSKEESVYNRIGMIYADVIKVIKKYKPDCVICEELFFFKNAKTVINVAQARGVIMLAAKNSKVPFFEYTPLQIKQALTGYGRADKKQIQEMTKGLLGLSDYLRPDDVADACASAICHANCVK